METLELTDAGRHALQARADVLVLVGLLKDSGSPIAESPLVAEIEARYTEAEDGEEEDAPPSLEDVIDDALAAGDWMTLRRLLPDITRMAPDRMLVVAQKICASKSAFVRIAQGAHA